MNTQVHGGGGGGGPSPLQAVERSTPEQGSSAQPWRSRAGAGAVSWQNSGGAGEECEGKECQRGAVMDITLLSPCLCTAWGETEESRVKQPVKKGLGETCSSLVLAFQTDFNWQYIITFFKKVFCLWLLLVNDLSVLLSPQVFHLAFFPGCVEDRQFS